MANLLVALPTCGDVACDRRELQFLRTARLPGPGNKSPVEG